MDSSMSHIKSKLYPLGVYPKYRDHIGKVNSKSLLFFKLFYCPKLLLYNELRHAARPGRPKSF